MNMSSNASRYARTATALLLFISASYIAPSPCSHFGADSMNLIGVYLSSALLRFLTSNAILFAADHPRASPGSTTNSLAITGHDLPIDA